MTGASHGRGLPEAGTSAPASTAVSDQIRIARACCRRSTIGLARYDEGAITARLVAHGLIAARAPHNLGHNQARMTFLCKPG